MPGAGFVAVVGEAVADAFPSSAATADSLDLRVRPGGSPVNTAVALARLGVPARFLGRLSPGVLGTLLRDHLAASGVDLSASITAEGSASLAIASVDPEGHTSYDFYLRGATDWAWRADELAASRVAGAACVHAGSLALALEPGGPLIEDLLAAVRPTATVSVDPNVRPGIVPAVAYQEGIERWCRLADILRMSDEDLAVLRPDGDFGQACGRWHAAGVRLVVLTRGRYGAMASLDGTRVEVPAVPVAVVDTVGAGDSFTAGLLRWLWHHGHLATRLAGIQPDDVVQAMTFAVEVAARTCAVQGADPPWARDLGLS
ncbi:MAG: fructokinase [Micromonosporaceae bacterium]